MIVTVNTQISIIHIADINESGLKKGQKIVLTTLKNPCLLGSTMLEGEKKGKSFMLLTGRYSSFAGWFILCISPKPCIFAIYLSL